MSETPKRIYKDCDGQPICLLRLIKTEPEWAFSQILHRDKLEQELIEARAEITDLKEAQSHDAAKLAPYILKKNQQLDEKDVLIKQMLELIEAVEPWGILNVNGKNWFDVRDSVLNAKGGEQCKEQ